MTLIQKFAETAFRKCNKVALITEKNQLSYEDLLNLLHCCDVQLQMRGLREGTTVVLKTDRAEINLIFMFLASYRSLNIIYANIESVIAQGIDFDYYISTEDNPAVSSDNKLIITGDWFATLGNTPVPDYRLEKSARATFTFTSSGSTGVPKFVRQSDASLLWAIENNVNPGEPSADTRYLATPSTTMAWAMFGNMAVLLEGGSVVILGENRDKILQYIDLYQVSSMIVTPALLNQIVEMPEAGQYLSSLRVVRVGGASTSVQLLARFREICDARLTIGYGSSETGGICTVGFSELSDKPQGCIGRSYRNDLETAFFDDDLNLLPGADQGIVGFKSTNPVNDVHYLLPQNDQKTGFVNGHFLPGDVMRRDGDWLFLIGRTKNIINFSGNKISLEAIQTVLETVTPNGLVTCISVPDDMGLEQLVVFYDGTDAIPDQKFNDVLREKFANISTRKIIHLPSFPLLPSGKLDIDKLRESVTWN
ncbi:MAG: AMP-binding protein [Rhodobacteraceae bacterium]|nr:AMP-binding protein [Paracoccaceae bacterium]